MTIKETAGKVLLYLYQLQRVTPLVMPHRQVGFIDKKDKGLELTSDKRWLMEDLRDINSAAVDTYNAFNFLLDKEFITTRRRVTANARVYVGAQLTAKGIDIVEGVERGQNGKRAFEEAFNIKVGSSMGTRELIDDKLSMLYER